MGPIRPILGWIDLNLNFLDICRGSMDEVSKVIMNSLDESIEIKKIQTIMDFSTEWSINDSLHQFHGKKYGIEWIIGMDQIGDFKIVSTSHEAYLQKIFGAFFKSLRVLVYEQQVKIFSFAVPNEYSFLRKFVNSSVFREYLEDNIGLRFFESDSLLDMNYWRFERF